MMKKLITYTKYYISRLLIAGLLLQFTSCKDEFLEAKPNENLAVPTTLQDFQGMLDNISIVSHNSPSQGEVACDDHYVTDASYLGWLTDVSSDSYIWSHTTSHNSIQSAWSQSYAKILYFNVILDGLAKYTPSRLEKEAYDNIKGQALFQRARTFFELAQVYAPPFGTVQENEAPGIVLRLSSDITLQSRRVTVEQTYSQIIDDLIRAKDLMPQRPAVLTRASKSAVLAFLARVYLSIGDYNNALKSANESLFIYSILLDYNSILPGANFIGRYNSEVVFHSNFSDVFVTSFCVIEKDLYNLYHENDLRRTRFYRVNLSTGTVTYTGNYEGTRNNLFGGLTTSELYLIRAECYARTGNTSSAMEDLNALMRKRWDKTVPYPEIIAINPEDALQKILTERRKELVLRNLRWSDLRRLNKDPRFAKTLTRTVDGVIYKLEPNSYKYTFPIPDDIIQQTGIEQNPGWPN